MREEWEKRNWDKSLGSGWGLGIGFRGIGFVNLVKPLLRSSWHHEWSIKADIFSSQSCWLAAVLVAYLFEIRKRRSTEPTLIYGLGCRGYRLEIKLKCETRLLPREVYPSFAHDSNLSRFVAYILTLLVTSCDIINLERFAAIKILLAKKTKPNSCTSNVTPKTLNAILVLLAQPEP